MSIPAPRIAIIAVFVLLCVRAQAAVGLAEIESGTGQGPVTVFYPSSSDATRVERGQFLLDAFFLNHLIRTVPLQSTSGRLQVVAARAGSLA